MSDHPEHDPAAALELIKAAQRNPQTRDAILDFLDRPPALLNGERGGYRYNDATTRKIKALVGQLRGLVEGGGIEKDIELRKQQIPACISDSALADDTSHATEKAKSSPQYGGNVVPFRPAQTE